MSVDLHNKITVSGLENLFRNILDSLWNGKAAPDKLPPLMVWGAPGLGKSTIIRSLAQEYGVNFIDVRLAQREPVDIRGLPVPTGNGVEWQVSAEWPRDPESRGIILFDELTAADRSLQVAAYEFILDRRLGDLYKVPGSVVCDTHCIRICERLGLSRGKDPGKVEQQLRKILPPEESSDFCHRIVLFGRDTCTARSPKCDGCPLRPWCKAFQG
jgi:hypothetical protein